jgi:hypothetical protein
MIYPPRTKRLYPMSSEKPVVLNEYDEDRRAELEFKDVDGKFHLIYVSQDFIRLTK